MKRVLVSLIAGTTLLAGCSQEPTCGRTKDLFLANYFALVQEATAADLSLSDREWEKYDERFRAYVEECYEQYEAELAGNERRKFWSRAMKYYAQRYGDGLLKSVGDKTDKTGQRIKEEVKKLWEMPSTSHQDLLPKDKKGSEYQIRKKGDGLEEQ